MSKEQYLDLEGLKTYKNNTTIENFDSSLLETSIFNNITDFSLLTTTDATGYNFDDTTNYNLVTIVFPQMNITDELLYMINFKVIINNTQKEVYQKIKMSDFIIKSDGVYCVIDATKTGIGDYLTSNPSMINKIKNGDILGTLFSCQLINSDEAGNIIVNGINNNIDAKNFIIVNGENNKVYGSDTRSLFVEGKMNDINNNDYSIVVGSRNIENRGGLGITVGGINSKRYTDYSNIFGVRNAQHFGTYIQKNKWNSWSIDTSKEPDIITVKFSVASEFTYLKDNLPEIGSTSSLAAHTFYGIRPVTVTAAECDSNNVVTISFTSADTSVGSESVLNWGNEVNFHGIMFTDIGIEKKNNSFISGEYNSSYSYGSGTFGFGNGSYGDYTFVAGRHNQVLGEHTSAFGWGNIISSSSGTALGSFCIDTDNTLLIVGNGTDKFNRSNALTLFKDGELSVAGDLKYNGNVSVSNTLNTLTSKLNSVIQELTQEKYNALSDEEKNNGTVYFVTDGV